MEYLSYLLYTILLIFILHPIITLVFDFFSIEYTTYAIYVFWFIALALLNALLPTMPKNIFGRVL
jgi:hypothetical protein